MSLSGFFSPASSVVGITCSLNRSDVSRRDAIDAIGEAGGVGHKSVKEEILGVDESPATASDRFGRTGKSLAGPCQHSTSSLCLFRRLVDGAQRAFQLPRKSLRKSKRV